MWHEIKVNLVDVHVLFLKDYARGRGISVELAASEFVRWCLRDWNSGVLVVRNPITGDVVQPTLSICPNCGGVGEVEQENGEWYECEDCGGVGVCKDD